MGRKGEGRVREELKARWDFGLLVEEFHDVAGLYVDRREHAIVFFRREEPNPDLDRQTGLAPKREAGLYHEPRLQSISTSVTLGGLTISVQSNPSWLFSGIEVSGNGVSAWSKHFWPSDGASGGSASPTGVSIGSNPNNSAEDLVTITQNVATAAGASAFSSTNGSAAFAAVSARSSSIIFVVNYATGQITAVQSSEAV